jgi:Zn-finger nucleic acid-binding protein
MLCPTDGTELVMADRSGIEIDYCPKCRGVWLDRGELDKIIERQAAAPAQGARLEDVPVETREPRRERAADPYVAPVRASERPRGDDRQREYYRYDDDDDDDDYRHGKPYRKRRGGFLSDLFDFD